MDLSWVDALQGEGLGCKADNIAACNKVTLHNAIEQLKEVAKSNGLKAVITFEAL